MKPAFLLIAVGCLLVPGIPATGQRRGGGGEQEAVRKGWLFSLAEGKALASKTGKPLMVVLRCVP
jgi:hypothetical protein